MAKQFQYPTKPLLSDKTMNLFSGKARDKKETMFAFRFPVAVVKLSRSLRSISILREEFAETIPKVFSDWFSEPIQFFEPIRVLLFMLNQFAL